MRQQRLGQAEQIAHSLPMGGVAHAGANLGGERAAADHDGAAPGPGRLVDLGVLIYQTPGVRGVAAMWVE
jgi:hypothetical protein